MSMNGSQKLERWTCEHGHKEWFINTDDSDKKRFVWDDIHDTDDRCYPDIETVPIDKIEEELF